MSDKSDKVILSYSGGLDTSICIKWIKEKYGFEVVTLTANMGQVKDRDLVQKRAKQCGAVKSIVVDVRDVFVTSLVFPALQAGAIYEQKYPLATALGRPLIAKLLSDIAQDDNAIAVAHGCTGKGNDQVRFDVSINVLAPDLKIIAPAREWKMTREEQLSYARKEGIEFGIDEANRIYSIDENLWGRSIECGELQDPWVEPPEEVFKWTKKLEEAPAAPEYVEIQFEKGTPVALDGQKMDGVSLIRRLNQLAGEHGVGRIDHLENRLVGIKSREIYEAPAATVLLQAHQALEAMTLSKDQLRFKQKVAIEYADLIYNGLWFSLFRQDLAAYVKSTQRYVSGVARVKLFKGSCQVVGRKSPNSLYGHSLATYGKGDQFDQSASPGFIHIWGLSVKTQAQAQPPCETEGLLSIVTPKKGSK
ncbi:MAG: argininosuccinate synthase [Dehalococcoidia bacterium]|nr:argininosuccinate synthase [Dehalococcoidia bacterium]